LYINAMFAEQTERSIRQLAAAPEIDAAQLRAALGERLRARVRQLAA
jgi:hypothetical protein